MAKLMLAQEAMNCPALLEIAQVYLTPQAVLPLQWWEGKKRQKPKYISTNRSSKILLEKMPQAPVTIALITSWEQKDCHLGAVEQKQEVQKFSPPPTINISCLLPTFPTKIRRKE
eukprot:TRINITY_DN28243_c0_g1_i1.p3 TRINITY_DN28243_c0_g1~~TRINITY_DN28243_c0_g1_i1.p3  ORF type:complete len:115 (-),score=17.92 TRINITY_DN28243_c0_g1_i1:172-516(-)